MIQKAVYLSGVSFLFYGLWTDPTSIIVRCGAMAALIVVAIVIIERDSQGNQL